MAANATNTLGRRRPGLPFLVVSAACATTVALLWLVPARMYAPATVLALGWGLAALVSAIGSIDDTLRNKVAANSLLFWFATAPFAWYFIRFPFAKSIVTFERLVFGVVGFIAIGSLTGWLPRAGRRPAWRPDALGPDALGPDALSSQLYADRISNDFDSESLAGIRQHNTGSTEGATAGAGWRGATESQRNPITKFEAVWLLLALLACSSAAAFSSSTGYALKLAVDAFALPLIAFYGARTYLKSTRHSRFILVTAMLLALFLLATGAFEFLTGINLLPYEGSELVREGELRVNGPFIADSSFAVVSLMLVVFLRSAPRMFRLRFDLSARVLYGIGIAGAIVSCLLPLFRAVAITLVLCWAAEGILTARPQESVAGAASSRRVRRLLRRQRIRSFVIAGIALMSLGAGVMLLAPANIRQRLTNPRNAYSRLLSWRVAANIIYRHPVFGVGLSNYVDYFDQEYTGGRSQLELELDTHIVEHPHSNVVWIATELGLVGLALYLGANILLLIPAYRALRRGRSARTRAAGACFIVLMAAYWIPGLELTSGMYSELNLYFFFLLGLIFPLLSLEGQPEAQNRELQL
jgi:O-antigen ligase